MEEKGLQPCPQWAEKLATLCAEDLSPSDQAALKRHLAECKKCAFIHHEYQNMRKTLSELISICEAPPSLPSKLLEQWENDGRNERNIEYSNSASVDVFITEKDAKKFGSIHL